MRSPALSWLLAALLLVGGVAAQQANGRVDQVDDLRIVHVWGSARERGLAHGQLLASEIARLMAAEFAARFAKRAGLLQQARASLGRVVTFPEAIRDEIDGVYAGVVAAGVSRAMPALQRDFDLQDLQIANALDIFGLMGCSGFTAWGEQVQGGGVLTGRNFDWPLTGPHLLDGTVLLVQHLDDGTAVASVTWPGFVGTVTGVSSTGLAVFLHVGSGKITLTPEPESWPTATAAQLMLRELRPTDPNLARARALELLEYTSPPAGFLTRLVLPQATPDTPPLLLFEADATKCLCAKLAANQPTVVTNHFLARNDGSKASKDSLGREQSIRAGLAHCLNDGDKVVSIDEGWQCLQEVQRGGRRAFGTLHALVFRHEPWHFELRIADFVAQKVVAAPVASRRYLLPRERLFPADLRPVPQASAGSATRSDK